mgnify:CR=1 FL=1
MDIAKLTQDGKCIFAIKLAERASSYLQAMDASNLINEAIQVAWDWIHKREDVGEILYDFLDNEENGFTLIQEMEQNEKNINAWNCIIDALAYISKVAYENEGVRYLPEPIESVDDNIFSHMIQSLILCNNEERKYIEHIYCKCIEESQ